jgi:hypothetical protein
MAGDVTASPATFLLMMVSLTRQRGILFSRRACSLWTGRIARYHLSAASKLAG